MKKKYTIGLIAIVALLTVSLSITTSYGLWKVTKNEQTYLEEASGCFEIVYNTSELIKMTDFKPINEEKGKSTSPYSFSIKNICDETKIAEVRLNLLEDNTLDTRALTLYMTGDIELGPIKYNDLKNSRTTTANISGSKILNSIEIKPNETKRTNIKVWIDEKIVSNIDPSLTFLSMVEITDKESIILPTFKETILEDNEGKEYIESKEPPNLGIVPTSSLGMYSKNDQDGNSYYFRGMANNNYVSFANLTWRIVRINGDETVRLILEDTVSETEYNLNKNEKDYAGYTYKGNDTSFNSTIKDVSELWYKENILDKGFDKYVAFSKFCNDTNSYQEGYKTYYNAMARLANTKEPSLTCTVSTEDFGGLYRLKVGLITADELVLAGANIDQVGTSTYINNGTSFYTMTPSNYYYYTTYMLIMNEEGSIKDAIVNNKKGFRPVISLKSNIIVTGKGTIDDPYKIDEEVVNS